MRHAIAVFHQSDIYGVVTFYQRSPSDLVDVNISITGLEPNGIHGFHIHEYGDMSDGCNSMGGHYNPQRSSHGSRRYHGIYRHVGDLINNIYSDEDGNVEMSFVDELITLFGPDSIIGRGIIIHAGIDDLGLGGNRESLITGNAGPRLACGVIGIRK